MPVLAHPPLGDVHAGHQFQPGEHLRSGLRGERQHVVQHAVHAQTDVQPVRPGIEMDVGRADLEGPFEQQIDKRGRADDVRQFAQLLLECGLAAFKSVRSVVM